MRRPFAIPHHQTRPPLEHAQVDAAGSPEPGLQEPGLRIQGAQPGLHVQGAQQGAQPGLQVQGAQRGTHRRLDETTRQKCGRGSPGTRWTELKKNDWIPRDLLRAEQHNAEQGERRQPPRRQHRPFFFALRLPPAVWPTYSTTIEFRCFLCE